MLSNKCRHEDTKMHASYYKTLAHHDIVLSWYKQSNTTLTSTHSMSNNIRNPFYVSWKGGKPLPQQRWKGASCHKKGRRRKKRAKLVTDEAQPESFHNLS